MSLFISPLALALGLAAAGLAAPQAPADAPGPAAPAAHAAAESPRPASDGPERAVILLSNGNFKIHEGTIVEEKDDYVLKHRSGTIRVPRRDVEEFFPTLEALYAYKADQIARRDPDEHMKLAQWCITQNLHAQAEEQLKAVLTFSPGNRRALGMLQNLQAAAEREQRADDRVVRTGMEEAAAPRSEVSVIDRIRSFSGPVTKPVIFDLTEGQAVRRYQEFGQTIHPLLQNACAKCHDENSGRNFQVIRAQVNKDLRNELLVQTNLEAVLGLVDRNSPERSELLVNAIMPHGPDRKPVIADTNAPEYRALWAWVENLRVSGNASAVSAPAPPGAAPAAPGTPAVAPAPVLTPVPGDAAGYGGGFAASRTGPVTAAQPGTVASAPSSLAEGLPPQAMSRVSSQTDRIEAVHPSVPPGTSYQTVSPLLPGTGADTARFGMAQAAPSIGAPVPPGSPTAVPPGTLPDLAPLPGQPGAVPAPGAFPTPIDPAAAPASADRPTGEDVQQYGVNQLVTRPDGSQFIRLKDGTEVPVMDRKAVERAKPASRKTKEFQINTNLLQQFQKQTRPGGN
jgi:hypothetical protein